MQRTTKTFIGGLVIGLLAGGILGYVFTSSYILGLIIK